MKPKFRIFLSILLLMALWSCSDKDEPMSVETEKEHVSKQTFYEIIPNTKWESKWRRFTDQQGNEFAETNLLATLTSNYMEFDENGYIVFGDDRSPTPYNEKTGYIENQWGTPLYYVAYLSRDRLVLCSTAIFGSVFEENADHEVKYRTALSREVFEPM